MKLKWWRTPATWLFGRVRVPFALSWSYECLRTALASHQPNYACTSLSQTQSQVVSSILIERPVFCSRLLPLKGETIVGWGRKWSGQRAVDLALQHACEFWLIEDGFLRSVKRDEDAVSLVFDNSGMYYDATAQSEFEQLVRQQVANAERLRSRQLTELWRSERLSKYNSELDELVHAQKPYVLVCDQTHSDASISYGLATPESFVRMLDAALIEYPNHSIILKTHPDVVTRGKKGHFALDALASNDRIQVISAPVHPSKLIENADAVYTVTSQMGFEALIWGKRVRCFGIPFYAGWGLTEDELPAPDRRMPVSFEQLVHAALVKYPRYIDPVTMRRCEPEVTFRHVGLQRRKRQQFPEQITAIGFSRWKRPFIKSFLQGSQVSFANKVPLGHEVVDKTALAVWGSRAVPDTSAPTTVLRIEDGFLRSSGLGADLVRPMSLVVDDIGIYYDATKPSRLEHLLESQTLDVSAIERARLLRDRLVELDLTKYNLAKAAWDRPKTNQPVLLVVGQVETDASIRLGSPNVQSNTELLQRVRQANPSAYIVYKPHPDVVAGLRKSGKNEDISFKVADEVLSRQVTLKSLLSQVDAVHTMTSLMGFEALIRDVKVVCYGLPFYAGWGLTEDKLACPRRTQHLTIDELVHGALIDYPRYFNYQRDCFVEPEQAIDQLAALANAGPKSRKLHRKLLRAGIIAWLKFTGNTR